MEIAARTVTNREVSIETRFAKKQTRLTPDDFPEKGDCYIFTALSATHKHGTGN
jgi:hypothetical protein